jgi:hypothetical protein
VHKEALSAGVCAAATGFALAFAFPAYAPVRVFWYDPLFRRWTFEAKASGLVIDWYGRSLLAALVAMVAFAVVYAIGRRWRPSPRLLRLWAAWTATACVLAMSLYVFQLARRVPTPAPLPPGYEAD